jgi:hypothetical protein
VYIYIYDINRLIVKYKGLHAIKLYNSMGVFGGKTEDRKSAMWK